MYESSCWNLLENEGGNVCACRSFRRVFCNCDQSQNANAAKKDLKMVSVYCYSRMTNLLGCFQWRIQGGIPLSHGENVSQWHFACIFEHEPLKKVNLENFSMHDEKKVYRFQKFFDSPPFQMVLWICLWLLWKKDQMSP